jgi:hypothetical protein
MNVCCQALSRIAEQSLFLSPPILMPLSADSSRAPFSSGTRLSRVAPKPVQRPAGADVPDTIAAVSLQAVQRRAQREAKETIGAELPLASEPTEEEVERMVSSPGSPAQRAHS